MKLVSMLYDDVTGVLMQCISRIPLSDRRKAKTPLLRGFRCNQIVASVAAEWRSSAKHKWII
ncbi:hypothetical protein, partial [Klebsiella grimontii]|uniref:hypothetical protein n=1 Tax=Klebsiella grimontii TaxID=2058152 RepID=UPI001C7FA85D